VIHKIKYPIEEFQNDVEVLSRILKQDFPDYKDGGRSLFGVPQGGVPLALELSYTLGWDLHDSVDYFDEKTVIVDDVCDSGRTRRQYFNRPFYVLHKKRGCEPIPTNWIHEVEKNEWIEYWWEGQERSARDIITRTLQYIGEDPRRSGLIDTPSRVLKAWDFMFSGYKDDPGNHATLFLETDDHKCDQMVLLRDIEMYSMCEHHILPFFGKAHIAYIPGERNLLIGVSKLARILDVFARRLQIQERIGEQVTTALMDLLDPVGAACIIEADHLCMRMRGVEKQNSIMTTSSLKGIFLEDSDSGRAARAELMRLIR